MALHPFVMPWQCSWSLVLISSLSKIYFISNLSSPSFFLCIILSQSFPMTSNQFFYLSTQSDRLQSGFFPTNECFISVLTLHVFTWLFSSPFPSLIASQHPGATSSCNHLGPFLLRASFLNPSQSSFECLFLFQVFFFCSTWTFILCVGGVFRPDCFFPNQWPWVYLHPLCASFLQCLGRFFIPFTPFCSKICFVSQSGLTSQSWISLFCLSPLHSTEEFLRTSYHYSSYRPYHFTSS